jgi:hypothetical protein
MRLIGGARRKFRKSHLAEVARVANRVNQTFGEALPTGCCYVAQVATLSVFDAGGYVEQRLAGVSHPTAPTRLP